MRPPSPGTPEPSTVEPVVLICTDTPGPIWRNTPPLSPWYVSSGGEPPTVYGAVVVLPPPMMYWPPYWALASPLTSSIS